jgi:hypothetical protein
MVKDTFVNNSILSEQCEWAIDLLTYKTEEGNLIIPNSDEIYYLSPFRENAFWNPILIHYNKNNNNHIFCRSEIISYLFNILEKYKINTPIVLFTGHSDETIDEKYLPLLNSSKLLHWYSINVDIEHDKLTPIPIGINSTKSNVDILDNLTSQNIIKDNLYYVNIGVGNHRGTKERQKCLQYAQKDNRFGLTRQEYFEELSKSYFTLSPNGNGIDCHRHWESLVLKTIPVVTKSYLTEYFSKIVPMVIIDDWSQFTPDMLSIDLYKDLWDTHPEADILLKRDGFFTKYIKEYNE